ncbi:hypothetical protein HOLleu_44990 [Holothuria leucospilota]|uniref:Uncharacterized protein n=1 Tax=Holothuria leucospilota TaxID=206669 RepID=A0A9Q0YF92_HOLLE|nr:hypothetical protein HOLleu_44990 [Holothuria leucospilota]
MEEIRQKRRARSSAKGNLTRKVNEIKGLSDDPDKVHEKCQELRSLLSEFQSKHEEYVCLLEDEDKEEAEDYFAAVNDNIETFLEGKIVSTDSHEVIPSVSPHDSVSQISARSSQSSLKVSRGKMLAAELKAEAEAIKQRHLLDMEELKLRQRREQLEINTKLAIAEARQDALTDEGSEVSSVESQVVSREDEGSCKGDSDSVASRKKGLNQSTPDQQGTSAPPVVSGNRDASVLEIIAEGHKNQRRLLEAIQLPTGEVMKFDGDPLQYWIFKRAFDNTVDSSMLDDSAKLTRLLHYCVGKAKGVIQGCSVMEPSKGYRTAKRLLQDRFGEKHIIAEAWVNKIVGGSSISPQDNSALREFADDLKSCKETLNAMGYTAEINTQTTLLKIAERLPYYLRSRWVRRAREIRKKGGKVPNIEDLTEFVDDAAEEANDPVYGRLYKLGEKREHRKTGSAKVTKPWSNSLFSRALACPTSMP